MSLKITIEVTGQTEQQLAPVVSQFVARHPELLGMGTQTRALGLDTAQDFYRDNSALLHQHIQELTAQNQRLQAQVTDSQRLLAGSPPVQACLPQAPVAERTVTAPVVSHRADAPTAPPLLPVQYRSGKTTLKRIKRKLSWLPVRCWQGLLWRKWLLIFLLLGGAMNGVLTLAPKIADSLWPPPEFVDSAEESPGAVTAPEHSEEKTPESSTEKAPKQTSSTSPTSKAGSHPAPPPAFQQP
jgi:hypothetical protein